MALLPELRLALGLDARPLVTLLFDGRLFALELEELS